TGANSGLRRAGRIKPLGALLLSFKRQEIGGSSPAGTAQLITCLSNRADIGTNRGYIHRARHVRAFGVGLDVWDMTGSTRSSHGLDDRRKRLLFRCWHRGTREMDLILGRFADAEIAELSDEEVAELERLIEIPDPDLYAALIGDRPLAQDEAGALFERIKAFRASGFEL